MKKAPLGAKRRKAIVSSVVAISLFLIIYGFYNFQKMKPANGQKTELKIETGDRPLKKNEEVYINADGGLSLRSERNQNSQRLVIIPNKTKLEATEELEGWYRVSFDGKEGWIMKQYTTVEAPAQDPYKDWTAFSGSGYKVKYPLGWKLKNYGSGVTPNSTSLVAFSNQDLPETVPQGTEFLAPITFNLSSQTFEEASKSFDSISGSTKESVDVVGRNGTKYTYTSTYSNTQTTAIVINLNGKALILSEAGGYQDDLMNMLKTVSF